MTWTETNAFLDTLRSLLAVHPLTLEIHETGPALAQRYGLSIYDAMIAASALHADCDTLWSEGMQDPFGAKAVLTVKRHAYDMRRRYDRLCEGSVCRKRCRKSKAGDYSRNPKLRA